MGRNNQRRRAEKKKRRAGRGSPDAGGSSSGHHRGGPWEDASWRVERLAISGAEAASSGAGDELDATCAALARCAESVGRSVVTTGISRLYCSVLAAVWDGGWQPLEVVRQVRRAGRGRHAEVIVASMGAEGGWEDGSGAAMPEVWAGQLRELGVERPACPSPDWLGGWIERAQMPLPDALATILETLGVLTCLPVIETLIPRPCEWDTLAPAFGGLQADDPVLAKIRALLAKAESTQFAAESDALTAKAQELMARHAIDDALSRAEQSGAPLPVARRLAVDDPYATAKSQLLGVIADANGVRCVWYERFAMMALVGFGADLDAVDMLFTSLLVQASRAMLAKGRVTDGRGRSRTRSFRQSFLLAFASRIHERLAFAAMSARQEAEGELGTSLLPVLAGRDREIDDAVATMFPHLIKTAGPAATNEIGWRAGRTAAELATLGSEHGMLDGLTATG